MRAGHERVPCAVPCFSVGRALSKRVALDAFAAAASGPSCGAVISATPEKGAAHPVGVALFIKMLRHAQLEHVAEYGQLLSLFNGHAHKAVQRRGLD